MTMSNGLALRDQIHGILTRAMGLLDEESTSLHEHHNDANGEFVARKNMIAFELGTIARMAERVVLDDDLRQRFADLRRKLEDNRKLLDVHIGASRQIARILAEVVRASEADGTYTVPLFNKGTRRD